MEGVTSPAHLGYYYGVLHDSNSKLAMLWLLAVNFTTMGGLLREKAVGAASFTLALPFSRARLMGVRIIVSLVESAALIVITWIVMFAVGCLFGKTHSISQALYHIVLLAGGGVVYYAIAVLASSVVEGEYTAPIVSFGIVVVLCFGARWPGFTARYSPLDLDDGGVVNMTSMRDYSSVPCRGFR